MLHSDKLWFQMKIPQNWLDINTSVSPVAPISTSLKAAGNTMWPEKKTHFLTPSYTWNHEPLKAYE